MKKNAILIEVRLLIVLLFVGNAACFYRLGFVGQLSAVLYDYRLQLTKPRTMDKRIVYFRKNPPVADWDGVFMFQTK